MEAVNQSQEYLNTKIGEIEPIGESRNSEIRHREDLINLVEGPLLSTCQELYDKNIRTLATSANKNDVVNGFAYIAIDFDSLSENNREIGRTLGEVNFADDMNVLNIKVPITTESTFGEVKKAVEDIANKFEKQPYNVITYTLENMRRFYGIDENDESFGPESFDKFYCSPEHKLFFLSDEQFRKATESIDTEGSA